MVKKYLLISALSFALLLSGCRGKMAEGEIYSKRFIPAHADTMLIPTIYSNGKTYYTILMPYVMTYPDAYEIKIRNYDANLLCERGCVEAMRDRERFQIRQGQGFYRNAIQS